MENLEIAKRLFLDGLDLLKNGNFLEAESKFLQSLELIPDRASTLTNLSAAQLGLGKFDEAAVSAQRAIGIDGANGEAWLNKGNALQALRRYGEALADFDRALALNPDSAQAWSNKGVALGSLKRFDEALAHYDHAVALNPDYAEGWSNKGLALRERKRHGEALAQYDRALALKADYAEAWSNKGLTLVDLQRYDEALQHYDQAIALKPDYAEAWSNKGAALVDLRRYDEALQHYERVLALNPDLDSVLADLIHTKLLIGDWHGLVGKVRELVDGLRTRHVVATPFALLSVTDSPDLHLHAAQIWVNRKYPVNLSLPSIRKRPHQKIRIGYFSADFNNHPVSHLTAELFEIHDRGRFEILGFSLRDRKPEDEMRARLRKAFDQFIDVENLSDMDAAKLSREREIDIAVDLGGHTRDARTGIFALRAAPIQANYLGYPGTLGAGYVDYIIADETVVPDDELIFYSEKIVYLPDCFQSNDTHRIISDKAFTRQELGLPKAGFVFCCFNNSYKINPALFESWMRILRNTERSSLWLLANSKAVETNFRNAAKKHGVDPDRLIFGGRLPPPEYLARYRVADLSLDTLPFNAGTTASDALWAGLPVLTQTGRSFSGRMATSLLKAIGLPELIAQTQEEYEMMAIELATNPDKLKQIRRKLAANRLATPLFDTPLFTRHIESAYISMYERYQADLPPEHLHIER